MSDVATPAPTATPAATPAPVATPTPTATPAATADWTAGFNAETQGYLQTKGFKDPAAVVDSYRGLEKMLGKKEQLLVIPEKEDDAAGWDAVYGRLGRPAKADEYKLPVPEGIDGEFAKTAASWFHKAGLSGKQATQVVSEWNTHVANMEKAAAEAYTQKVQGEEAALKKEWGAAYEPNLKVARAAARTFGISDEQFSNLEKSMGLPAVAKFLHSIGSKLGEDKFVSGSNGGNSFGGVLTPQQAHYQLGVRKSDKEFMQKWFDGNAEARAEMQRLHEYAYPESA